jgi:hypothetical protein
MTATAMLDLKERLGRLTETERRQVAAHLLRLKHESPAWKKEISRRMREMDAGKKIRAADLMKQLGHA